METDLATFFVKQDYATLKEEIDRFLTGVPPVLIGILGGADWLSPASPALLSIIF
ncbi:hypothetical protein [Syntrophomonas wolfei]|jgi:hypothetical protein|uniref:hypothetical protein n=1 Tax=Syntrophomonas wolfei TaxID=863 RepID=UPI0023F03E08|nr:hypothetical protein [Syntrophomonas wolfei]